MGGHIPKSAQRALDKANKASAARLIEKKAEVATLPLPRFMAVGMTPRNIINMHEVYFNGERQQLCTIADVDKGFIRRWMHGKGNVPAKDSPSEDCFGKVEIKRRIL